VTEITPAVYFYLNACAANTKRVLRYYGNYTNFNGKDIFNVKFTTKKICDFFLTTPLINSRGWWFARHWHFWPAVA